jgi:phosphatidylglycerophosphatase A
MQNFDYPSPPPRATVSSTQPTWRMLRNPLHLFALGFGTGLSPLAPGTIATLFAWFSFVQLDAWVSDTHWLIMIVIGLLVGIVACKHTGQALGEADHSAIVWDEILAFWIILLLLSPSSWVTQCWAFLWFRALDIIKPGPICYVDQRMSGMGWRGAFGVMLDDLLAAFLTLLIFALWRALS